MNWVVVGNERSLLQEYRLIDNNDCIVVIKYNPRHQSARITCGSHHRLVYFESTGSLSGKTVFRNEYGMEVGNLVHEKFHPGDGSVLIENQKYRYRLFNDSSSRLVIYENNQSEPVASCNIPATKTSRQSSFLPGTQAIDNKCYLLGLCWYLFLPLLIPAELKSLSTSFS